LLVPVKALSRGRDFFVGRSRSEHMMDAVYLIAGIVIFGVFGVYAVFLKRV
jgi:hypothetical protein